MSHNSNLMDTSAIPAEGETGSNDDQPPAGATNPPDWFGLAQQEVNLGRIENAFYFIEEALVSSRQQTEPRELGLLLDFYGQLLIKMKDYEKALQIYSELVPWASKPAAIYNQMGLICEKLARLPEASSYFLQALQLSPRDHEFRANFQRIEKMIHHPGKLSICMLVTDDPADCHFALENIAAFASEIIFITSQNPEKFRHLHLKSTPKLVVTDWQKDRAAARNEALKHATGDWILWLDANEEIPSADQEIIQNLLSAERNKAFYFHFYQTDTENQVWLQLRMFPNLPGIQFTRPFYEDISHSAIQLGLHLVNSGVKITQVRSVDQKSDATAIYNQMTAWIQEHPADCSSRFLLGLHDFRQRRTGAALVNFDQLIDNPVCAKNAHTIYLNALVFKARTLIEMKNYPPAVELLQQARKVDDRYYLTLLTLGEVYTELNQPDKAMEYLKKCPGIALKPTIVPLNLVELQGRWYFLVGRNWMLLKKYDQASLHFKKARMFLSESPALLRIWAQCCREMEKFKEAQSLLENALALDSRNPLNYIEMGYLHLQTGQAEPAQEYFHQALELDKKAAAALRGLALAFQMLAENEEALGIWQKVTKLEPENPENWINLAYLLLKQNQFNSAEKALVTAQNSGALPLTAALALTYVYAHKQQFPRLLLTYRDLLKGMNGSYAVQLAPTETFELPNKLATEFLNLAVHLISRNNSQGAVFALLTASELAPDQHKTSAMLADLYFNHQDFTSARHILEKLVVQEPQNPAFLRKLGDCYLKIKIDNAAQMCYWRAREVENMRRVTSQRMALGG